jgi:uncharacterized membrane protein
MSQAFITLSFWLHALGTVILIGHYLLLSLVYLPVFDKNWADLASRNMLSEISRRSRSWLYASLLVFAVTGTYLTLVDSYYLGIGNFGNIWSILMLVKHILILGMLVIGFWYNGLLRVGPQLVSNSGGEQALVRFRQYSNLMAIIGVLVLLLTAISQVQ